MTNCLGIKLFFVFFSFRTKKKLADLEAAQQLPIQVRIQKLEHDILESKAEQDRLTESLVAASI